MDELTIRDWMVIVGAVMILAVLLDAARRVWTDRRAEVRLNAKINRDADTDREEEAFNLLSELPNGGARIVARDDLQPTVTPLKEEELEPLPQQTPTAGALQDTAGLDNGEPHPQSTLTESPPEAVKLPATTHPSSAATTKVALDTPQEAATRHDSSNEADHPETMDWLESLEQELPESSIAEAKLPRDIDAHVFVLNVEARAEAGFSGRDILQILLACDLRFGDMDFFHRHESASGRGPIQFSVANMMNPGVFDIDMMDQLYTRGLMFFVTLPGPDDMLQAFDYMFETARTVARNLDGDVLDETRSAITNQSLEHMRQQIRELERRMMVTKER